jgi:hypothetical protein
MPAWEALKFAASATALMTALLFYFGWVRTQKTYAYFGIDTGLLGLTTPDYLLRSVNSALPPAVGVALLGLGLVSLRRWLLVRIADNAANRRRLGLIAAAMRAAAVILLGVAAAGIVAQNQVGRPLGMALPLALPLAAGLLVLAGTLRSPTPDRAGSGMWSLLVAALALLGLLWAVALYAQHIGQRVALGVAGSIATRSEVVLYSTERVSIAGTGVAVTALPKEDSKYRFRYTGLRMLIYANDRYFLLPANWQRGRDSVFVIENDDVRVDVRARPS